MSVSRFLAALGVAIALGSCDRSVHFSVDEVTKAKLGQGLRPGFLLGAATAPHQVEGGNDNDWTGWERGHHIPSGDSADLACDSWNRYPQDIAALEQLGANAYRLGIEWSRIEPAEGQWNEAAIAHYREILLALRARKITPAVTVYHYTLPNWVAARGGWEWEGILPAITEYTRKVGEKFGDLVDVWITVNEPNAIAAASYAAGLWPPGVSNLGRSLTVYAKLIEAHASMAAALRSADHIDADGDGAATFIGLAHNLSPMQPASLAAVDIAVAGMADDLLNEAVPRAGQTGWIRIHVPGVFELDRFVPGLKGSFDYLGINYYHRQHLRAGLTHGQLAELYVPQFSERSQAGWELYPEGLYAMLLRYKDAGMPIMVTENGIADSIDLQRPYFLRAHLYAVQRAVAEGVDVRGYFHWSLMDNFEWDKGYALQFGLFWVDRASPTLERIPRPSVEVFQEAARGLGLTPGGG